MQSFCFMPDVPTAGDGTCFKLAEKNGHIKCAKLLREAEQNTSVEDSIQNEMSQSESAEDEKSSVIGFLRSRVGFYGFIIHLTQTGAKAK